MTEKLDLEAIEARCEAARWKLGRWWEDDTKIALTNSFRDIPALAAEVRWLRASLEAVLEEATSDLDRDIIITECQSALKGS